ncbi:MAG: hypothetical protein JXD22_16735 [Sedimentisphaerales bacterium]|nr:hypothetical protein [Sedimentisphaerales bacterium]
MNKEICCPKFEPAPWDNTTHKWTDKKFIRDKVFSIFYMPINFGKVMKKLDKLVKKANGTIPNGLGLSDHTSKWNMNVYLAVDKEIPEAENVTLSGEFFSKVYEGPYKDTPKWCKDFEALAKSKNLSIKKQFMWYTTCPKCAKEYGKNYVVIIGKTD